LVVGRGREGPRGKSRGKGRRREDDTYLACGLFGGTKKQTGGEL